MPGMDGIALLNQVHQRTPELPVIIIYRAPRSLRTSQWRHFIS
ncbi:nitrogen regulation protein NR(I) [Vibrio cholerae]|nr:nitrogen regulation protein NR(I) [Vibrio cholerae]